MFDPQTLSTALLAAVPEDGSSIGNQSLLDSLKGQFGELTEEQFTAARDALIEGGQLRKGRGRGGSVLRGDGTAPATAKPAKSKPAKQAKEVAPAETGIDGIKRTLWASADKLRANMDAAEYKHIVLGLIFIKYVSDTFQARRSELERRFTDESDDYYLHDADAEFLAEELEERDYYREVNVFWVPEGARWEALRASAKQADIGKRIDDALVLIEQENPRLKGILDKRFARAQLPDGKLGELVDLVSTIGFGDEPGAARDVLGQVYEYFLGEFANAEGKKGGQFYTPASIVQTLVAVLAPHHGQVYDPCCGSGGMFVQSERFIESHGGKLGDVSIYGQESNPTTWRLAAMNLAIRGMDYNLGREPGDTFTRNQHPDLRADFVLANPPFNISDWWHGSLDFEEMPPRPDLLDQVEVEGVNIGALLRVMNQRIELLLDRDHCLGHAYFMPLKAEPTLKRLGTIFQNQILPLLQEYFFEDWQRIAWVLNDHRKGTVDQFLQAPQVDVSALFGDQVPVGNHRQRWALNESAFARIGAYSGIIKVVAKGGPAESATTAAPEPAFEEEQVAP